MNQETRDKLRKVVLTARKNHPPSERQKKSLKAHKLLLQLDEFQQAKNIFCYVSYQSELQTYAIIEERLAQRKTVTVPLTIPGKGLEAYEITNLQKDLAPGYCSIPEPIVAQTKKCDPSSIDVVLLPGSVFDLKGGRLGYGGGYYDRFLDKSAPNALRIGLAFELQIVDFVPLMAHDKPIDYLVTEKRIIKTSVE